MESRRASRSDYVDGVGRHPDIELLEPAHNPALEVHKEGAALRFIRNVDEYPHKIVPEDLLLMLPKATNGLRLTRDGAKPLP